ncbi:MAG: quinol:cytochrome C oxidoreductase [Cytophagales bacterium]|nr:quinol:cytochrome C oxidoreductase [Cytophagales bacterium]
MTEEKLIFTPGARKKLMMIGLVGAVLALLGAVIAATGGGHHGETAEAAHHGASWVKRIFSSLWINNVYFTGIAIIGVFFVALQYVTQSGWSAPLKRIPEAFGYWLPIAGVLMLAAFFASNFTHNNIFHWTHAGLTNPSSPDFDPIIYNKRAYLNQPFFIARTVIYFAVWFFLFAKIRKYSLLEDKIGGTEPWYKMRRFSTIFIIFFAVTSSTSAWDWVMSVDPHWFSTLFGWYTFSSYFVAGLAVITYIVIRLKEKGYLQLVNQNHIHDLGKFIFGFSIFWAYLWVSQYLLYYYANIPEEIIYFYDRVKNDFYSPFFFLNVILNFAFPFLVLMTRDSKRQFRILKMTCIVVVIGHWLDFYLAITPGVMQKDGAFGLLEIGFAMLYLSAFGYVVLTNLSKAGLVAKHHPMLEEAKHHHI